MTSSTAVSDAPPPNITGQNIRTRVALVQPLLAHYRSRIFLLLDRDNAFEFTFVSGGRDMVGVPQCSPDLVRTHIPGPISWFRSLAWQHKVVGIAGSDDLDALIVHGDPHYISTWVAAGLARLRGTPVLFWTHGWRRPDASSLTRLIRLAFYRLADHLLVYSERGKQLGVAAGYPAKRMTVIYNSLDLDQAKGVLSKIERGETATAPACAFFPNPTRPLPICTARLTELCRFDILLRAAAFLGDQGHPVNILLVGDGPMRGALEALAQRLGVNVHFTGAVYDEATLGPWLYDADITVSPGKVGLTALHSMMYGTPVITHGNLDAQMPEVETIAEGETGAFFKQDDAGDLARVISEWLAAPQDRADVRARCRAVIQDKWNPDNQARLILGALEGLKDTARRGVASAA